jgi:NAD(P)-dependent dehydrogenase (short-subunit alcohol dehydrogenase family)
MLDQRHGSIINIGSTVVVRGSARAPQYAAAKYGIIGLTKSYAAALAPAVRVNVFAPGFIETAAKHGRSVSLPARQAPRSARRGGVRGRPWAMVSC